jgi:hypothetical protein
MQENNRLYSIIIGFEVLKFALIAYLLVPMPQMPVVMSTEEPGKEPIIVNCYADMDRDGYGAYPMLVSYIGYCPSGYTTNNDDCNDRFDDGCVLHASTR